MAGSNCNARYALWVIALLSYLEEGEMQTRLKNTFTGVVPAGLCAAIALGFTTGSVLAHDINGSDNHYDDSKQPYEQPYKAEPPKGGHASLAEAATNPIANLVQFQLQNQYNWDNYNSSGYSNEFLIQPVIPVKLSSKAVPLLITRTTIPYVSTPDLGDPINRETGLGDTTVLLLGVPSFNLNKQTIGLGLSNVLPTAGSNEFTGGGKYLTGPAGLYINQMFKGLQFGFLGWHHFTVAQSSSGTDKKDVTETAFQPFITKHFSQGWYVGSQDVPWNYNWRSKRLTMPMGPKVGRVFAMGKQKVNLFGAVYYNPNDDGPNAKWTAKINFTLLFPK
jgi:hypothetical protein